MKVKIKVFSGFLLCIFILFVAGSKNNFLWYQFWQDIFHIGLSYCILFIIYIYCYLSPIKLLSLCESVSDNKNYVPGGARHTSERIPLLPQVICNLCRGEVNV